MIDTLLKTKLLALLLVEALETRVRGMAHKRGLDGKWVLATLYLFALLFVSSKLVDTTPTGLLNDLFQFSTVAAMVGMYFTARASTETDLARRCDLYVRKLFRNRRR